MSYKIICLLLLASLVVIAVNVHGRCQEAPTSEVECGQDVPLEDSSVEEEEVCEPESAGEDEEADVESTVGNTKSILSCAMEKIQKSCAKATKCSCPTASVVEEEEPIEVPEAPECPTPVTKVAERPTCSQSSTAQEEAIKEDVKKTKPAKKSVPRKASTKGAKPQKASTPTTPKASKNHQQQRGKQQRPIQSKPKSKQ